MSVRPSVRPSVTHELKPREKAFLTKITISTSENASHGRVSGLVSLIIAKRKLNEMIQVDMNWRSGVIIHKMNPHNGDESDLNE